MDQSILLRYQWILIETFDFNPIWDLFLYDLKVIGYDIQDSVGIRDPRNARKIHRWVHFNKCIFRWECFVGGFCKTLFTDLTRKMRKAWKELDRPFLHLFHKSTFFEDFRGFSTILSKELDLYDQMIIKNDDIQVYPSRKRWFLSLFIGFHP